MNEVGIAPLGDPLKGRSLLCPAVSVCPRSWIAPVGVVRKALVVKKPIPAASRIATVVATGRRESRRSLPRSSSGRRNNAANAVSGRSTTPTHSRRPGKYLSS